ncbi:MAG: hypothetical protein V4525_12260 [Pseudomonadota bacterium]
MKENFKKEKIGGYIGLFITIVIFQLVAPKIFESPSSEKGINLTRTFFASITGIAGWYIGVYIAKFFSKKS